MICDSCLSPLTDPTTHYFIKHVDTPDNHLCSSCVKDDIIYKNAINGNLRPLNFKDEKSLPTGEVETKDFNEPTHYHKYEIDTIEFL
jgi:hypothetical protein